MSLGPQLLGERVAGSHELARSQLVQGVGVALDL
jgi:hypothetical protein